MANFETAVDKTLVSEGGSKFTDDPDDGGGATKYGISQRSFPDEDIRNLTEARAKEIYKEHYWDKVRGDDITSQIIAEAIFDTAVNMGVRTGSKLAQRCLKIEPDDGRIGPQSLGVINVADETMFLATFALKKIERYARICTRDASQKKYLLGWINRTLKGA